MADEPVKEEAVAEDTAIKRKRLRIVRRILIGVIIVCLGFLVYYGGPYVYSRVTYNNAAKQAVQFDSSTTDLSKMNIDWDRLKADNPDVVGWIRIPGTLVDYPIVQGSDNSYYLSRTYDGKSSWLTTGGTVFLEASNASDFSDKNNVLYGHNMLDGSMFATISSLVSQNAFDAHRTIYILTPKMNYCLKTFSVVKTSADDAIIMTKFSSNDSFSSYVKDKVNRNAVSVSNNDPNTNKIEKMFMFVTCEYSQTDGRACVFAAVTDQAKPSNS